MDGYPISPIHLYPWLGTEAAPILVDVRRTAPAKDRLTILRIYDIKYAHSIISRRSSMPGRRLPAHCRSRRYGSPCGSSHWVMAVGSER
jgi:hypothetical protein